MSNPFGSWSPEFARAVEIGTREVRSLEKLAAIVLRRGERLHKAIESANCTVWSLATAVADKEFHASMGQEFLDVQVIGMMAKKERSAEQQAQYESFMAQRTKRSCSIESSFKHAIKRYLASIAPPPAPAPKVEAPAAPAVTEPETQPGIPGQVEAPAAGEVQVEVLAASEKKEDRPNKTIKAAESGSEPEVREPEVRVDLRRAIDVLNVTMADTNPNQYTPEEWEAMANSIAQVALRCKGYAKKAVAAK